jgi:hypothetical protein
MVTVGVDLESREYNGRWYTEARAWKLTKDSEQQSAPLPDEEPFFSQDTAGTDDMPF